MSCVGFRLIFHRSSLEAREEATKEKTNNTFSKSFVIMFNNTKLSKFYGKKFNKYEKWQICPKVARQYQSMKISLSYNYIIYNNKKLCILPMIINKITPYWWESVDTSGLNNQPRHDVLKPTNKRTCLLKNNIQSPLSLHRYLSKKLIS